MARVPKVCSVEGCEQAARCRGWCNTHYGRWHKYGDPLHGGAVRRHGAGEQFLQESVLPFKGDRCLYWPFGKNSAGYGQLRRNGRVVYVHRVVCEAVHGDPPTPKHEVAHSCGNGHLGCVNPRHLRWATRKENMADARRHGTLAQGEAHGNAKLTVEQVLGIRRQRGRELQRVTAVRFGTSVHTVVDVQTRRSWKHLPKEDLT